MTHCVECRFWESSDMDGDDGRAICLKLTEGTMESGQLVIIRTRGDSGENCRLFKSMTVDNLMGKGSA